MLFCFSLVRNGAKDDDFCFLEAASFTNCFDDLEFGNRCVAGKVSWPGYVSEQHYAVAFTCVEFIVGVVGRLDVFSSAL